MLTKDFFEFVGLLLYSPIPELVVAALSLTVFAICLCAWLRHNEYAALGYLIPTLFFAVAYTLFYIYQTPDDLRRFWGRIGIIIILANIGIERISFMIRNKKQHGGDKNVG